jgi:acyl-CoA hydrolase
MEIVTAERLGEIVAGRTATPRVVASGNAAFPHAAVNAIDAAVSSYRLFVLNAHVGIPDRTGVVYETCFVGPGMRHRPNLAYVPARLSMVPRLFRSTLPPDVVCLNTTVPGGGGVSLGVEVNILPAALEACRERGGIVVAQLNGKMPWTHGDGEIPTDHIDYALEADEPLHAVEAPTADDAARTIGELVAARVQNGATLQLGIGVVPDAALPGLSRRTGLRVWSEMFSDGVIALDAAGALDAETDVIGSFVLGSQALYAWVDRNPRVRVLRTERTNAPAVIASKPGMTSINTALQVDLFGQANASRISARIHSGFGGQTDFIVGALHAPDGQAIMALRSWHPKADMSSIVAMVDEPVTSFQHTAVVTENGVAEMFGYDERAQARHLIDHAAHPRVREELREEAVAMGLAG